MAHELTTRKSGKVEMAYTGDRPWHGLGQRLEPGADINTWAEAAGMDWRVARSRVRYGEGPAQRVYEDKHVLFRSDDKTPLSVVSAEYKVVQPVEMLEFFRDLVGAAGYSLHTAGTLFGGKRFWALASVGAEAVVVGEDRVGGYLLLSSSCDGSMATAARFTTVRVVCNNTLSMAATKKAEVSVSHRTHFDPAAVKAQLGVATGQFAEFMVAARALAKKRLPTPSVEATVARVLLETKAVSDVDRVKESPAFRKIMGLFAGSAMGGTLAGAEGTAWGMVNAVTEYVDHHARAGSADNRAFNAWFGRGDTLKSTALTRALELV